MIKAKVYGTHIRSGYGSGVPSAVFDSRLPIQDASDNEIAGMFEESALKPGYATDRLAQYAREYNEKVDALFNMLNAANTLGIDLGGYDVEVQDKAAFTEWVKENRPEVLEDLNESEYAHLLESNED